VMRRALRCYVQHLIQEFSQDLTPEDLHHKLETERQALIVAASR
jgi:hypothetical protein